MKSGGGARRDRMLGAAIAAIVVAGVLMLFRAPRAEVPAEGQTTESVSGPPVAVDLTRLSEGAEGALDDQARLGDPTPLFLPTQWNAGQGVLPDEVVREPGQQFRTFPPKLVFGGAELKLDLPLPVPVPSVPAVALGGAGADVLGGMGQAETVLPGMAERGAFIAVTTAGTGRQVLAEPVQNVQPPGGAVWQPMEFLIAVDAAGLVGPPVQILRSGTEELDAYFQAYIAKDFEIGARLEPGLYRVAVGP